MGIVVVAALGGCNALTGVGDLEPALEGTPPIEAGPPPTDAAASDVPADTAPPIDTGVDAGPCPLAAFCDDYQSGKLAKWTSLLETNSWNVSVVDTTKLTRN